MGINLLRYDDSTATSKDDAILHEKTVGQTGIISGCVLTHLGANQVRISSGKGVYKGRDFNVVEEILLCAMSSSGTVPGRIYVHIDLSDTVSPIELLSVASSPLPYLVDDDNFNDDFGIGDMELATYNTTITAISGLTMTFSDVISCQDQIEELRQSVPGVVNTNTTTSPGYAADARQLNPNIPGSLATRVNGNTVYTNPSPTATFTAKTVTLSQSAANFTKAEVIFKVNNGLEEYSTTGVLDIALIKTLRAPFFIGNLRSVSISGTSAVFGSGYTYNTYSNGTGTQADGYCVPYKIIFY